MAIKQSGLIYFANSGLISGSGFAIANMIGFWFIFSKTSLEKLLGPETPIKTSAPLQASAREVFFWNNSD